MPADASLIDDTSLPVTGGQLPDRAVLLLGLFGLVGVWLLFVTVFSDVYQNTAAAALLLALLLLGLAVIAGRFPKAAVIVMPTAFVAASLSSTLPFFAQASPRGLLPSQIIFALALGAGIRSWRQAPRRGREWAVMLLSLAALLSLQAQWHSDSGLSSTFWGIPLALGAALAASAALVGPPPRLLAAGYVAAGVLLTPWVILGVFRYGRIDVEIGGFSINFLSALLGLSLVACAVLRASGVKGWPVVAASLLGVAVVLANSKTTLLAVLVCGVLVIWMQPGWLGSRKAMFSAALIVAIVAAFLVPSLMLSRAARQAPLVPGTRTLADASMSSRLRVDLALVSAPNILQSPLLGVGQERNVVYYRTGDDGEITWSRSPMSDATGSYAPHTFVIGLPAALGVPLATTVVGLWMYAALARRRPEVRRLMVPLVVFVAVSALTIDWDRSNMAPIVWLPVGLLLAAKTV